ncbi:helix-turn-helix domain-containing protein [Fodinisporobacter ferrooxydans]|uniref:Helix-turn-helix domain-containing protein n=1 Tax=Fodinisporobacter ferrooxydans TaxID=2901836 RepID=A0ABY4CGA7_9BACL|nr:helix-turn-helix domain-containing protein [Alicyclobacillaceae bacterium MYW30-H2]
MLMEHDHEKLWDAAIFLAEHDRLSEMEPIIKVLLGETLNTLEKPTYVIHQLDIALSSIDSTEDLSHLKTLETTIKQYMKAGDLQSAHKVLIEYISAVAVNRNDIIASLLSFNPESIQDSDEAIEGFYRVGEVAKKLGVSTQTVKRHCEEGRFPGATKTPGGHWRIPKSLFRTTDEQDAKAEKTLRRLDEKNRAGGEVDDEFNLI